MNAPALACSDAERRLAVRLHDGLRARGHEAWLETHWVRPQWVGALMLGSALAVAGSLVSVRAPLAGVVAAVVAAVGLAVEASGRSGPLRWAFPRRATQVVLTVPPLGRPAELLVCAPTDAPRAGMLFPRPAARLAGARPWLALCALAIAATAAARHTGDPGTLLGVAQLVPTVVLLVAFGVALDVALARVAAPPPKDAVAGALALHAQRPEDCALVLHGAAVPGLLALRAHLRGERPDPATTAAVLVGDGTRRRIGPLRVAPAPD